MAFKNHHKKVTWEYQTPSGIRLMFATGAAIHVCPPWFGDMFPTYTDHNLHTILGPDGSFIPSYGMRTVYIKMLPDMDAPVGLTFTVCNVREPILSFRQMKDRGYGCSLQEDSYLQISDNLKIPIVEEGQHFYIKPV